MIVEMGQNMHGEKVEQSGNGAYAVNAVDSKMKGKHKRVINDTGGEKV